MKKENAFWIILDLVFLAIFNTLFFTIGGTEHNISVWMSYGFIHFAYLMLVLTPFFIRCGKSAAVFGFALYSIAVGYFIIQFITSIIFILVASESYYIALLVQLCIAGLFVIILISNMISNERTADFEEKRQVEISFLKNASAKLKGLLYDIADKDVKKKVERIYDTLYSSPVISHQSTAQIDEQIMNLINELENAISIKNNENIILITKHLQGAVNDRNIQCKL